MGKTVPEVVRTARGRRPRAVRKTEGTVFPNTNRTRLMNNIFIFFLETQSNICKKNRLSLGCNHGKKNSKI